MYEWRTSRSCLYKNTVHLIFVTKYRRDVLTLNMLNRLQDIFIETAQQMDCELLEFGGEDDHVHLMISVNPKVAAADLVRKLKKAPSEVGWINFEKIDKQSPLTLTLRNVLSLHYVI